MAPPDDTPFVTRVLRRLDWWFTPPWRALLTWIGLAILAECDYGVGASYLVFKTSTTLFMRVDGMLSAPVPPVFWQFARELDIALLYCWFEPLALRLNLRRGLVWLALRCLPTVVVAIVVSKVESASPWVRFVSTALPGLALIGWRSRPWMTVVGGAVQAGSRGAPGHMARRFLYNLLVLVPALHSHGRVLGVLLGAVFMLPFPMALLYGTRLLTPEERERGSVAREPTQ